MTTHPSLIRRLRRLSFLDQAIVDRLENDTATREDVLAAAQALERSTAQNERGDLNEADALRASLRRA